MVQTQNFSNLTGKVLIATPHTMEGNVFHQSMIYVIQHTEEGSIGLIINRPIKNLPDDSVLKRLKDTLTIPEFGLEVYVGGPVELERGFFLHSMDYDKNVLFKSSDGILAVSSNKEIVNDVSNNKGPEHALFIIGYTGWTKGQIEFELENNLWIITEPDIDLIFSGNPSVKWEIALSNLGISSKEFINGIGHC